jgi:hypothetical protein
MRRFLAIFSLVWIALEGRPCRAFPSNLRVKAPAAPPYRYPDLTALCGKPIYENIGGVRTLTNPMLIAEVLSPSTESFDRGISSITTNQFSAFANTCYSRKTVRASATTSNNPTGVGCTRLCKAWTRCWS